MAMDQITDPVLTRFRRELDAAYGERLERVILFGSRARGDAREDSDYDVAVFLKDFESFGEEMWTIAEIETSILLDMGAVIHAMPYRAGDIAARTAFMGEVRREGVAI